MNSLRQLSFAALGIMGLITALPEKSHGGVYSFTKITDSHDFPFGPFPAVFSSFDLNNNGEVAFGTFINGGGPDGIYKGSGGAITTIDTTLGLSSGAVAINDAGVVAYVRTSGPTGPPARIVRSDGVVIDEVTDFGPPYFGSSYIPAVDITNTGDVAFIRQVNHATGLPDAARGNGSSETILTTFDAFSGSFPNSLRMNNNGDVMFFDFATNQMRAINGVNERFYPGEYLQGYDLNDSGHAVYTGVSPFSFQHRAVMIDDQVAVAASDSPLTSDFYNVALPAINNHDDLAFYAAPYFSSVFGLSGIYTGANALGDEVISVGDTLDGSIVNGFYVNGHNNSYLRINDQGQIAFVAILDNYDRYGLFVATPVPEVSSSHVCLVILVAIIVFRLKVRARST